MDKQIESIYQDLKLQVNKIKQELKDIEVEREEAIKNAVIEIDRKKERLIEELLPKEKAIKGLKPDDSQKYNKDEAWKEKIIWVLSTSDRILSISDITTKIREKDLNIAVDLKPIIRITIYRMVKKKEVIQYKDKNLTGARYGLPEWFINGQPVKGYL